MSNYLCLLIIRVFVVAFQLNLVWNPVSFKTRQAIADDTIGFTCTRCEFYVKTLAKFIDLGVSGDTRATEEGITDAGSEMCGFLPSPQWRKGECSGHY